MEDEHGERYSQWKAYQAQDPVNHNLSFEEWSKIIYQGREFRTKSETLVDDRQLRLSCISLAVEAVNHDPERDVDAVMPLAEKMYEWVKGK